VILSSDKSAAGIRRELEEALPKTFKLDSDLIAVLVLTRAQLRAVVRDRPKGFGDKPDTYHSDSVFLMGIDATTATKVFDPRPGVDEIWLTAASSWSCGRAACVRRPHVPSASRLPGP
jgi:uncharacterized protein (DUF1697 family)